MSTYRNQQTICVSAGVGALRHFIARLVDYAVGSEAPYTVVSAQNKPNWLAQETWSVYEDYLVNNVGSVDQAISAMDTANTGYDYTSQVIHSMLAPSVLSKIFPNLTIISIDSSQTNTAQLGYNFIVHECHHSEINTALRGARVKGVVSLLGNNPIDWAEVISDPHRKDRHELRLLSVVIGRDDCATPPSIEGADVVVDFAKLTARPKNNAETVASELNLILDAVDSKIVKDRAELHALWLATVNSLTYIDPVE